MNVFLEQVAALNYATTQLEAIRAPVTLVTHSSQLVLFVHVLVSVKHCCANPTTDISSLQYLDNNECIIGTSGCTQQCNNTVGSYTCSCRMGYTLDADNRTCNGEYKNYFTLQLLTLPTNRYQRVCAWNKWLHSIMQQHNWKLHMLL